MHHALLLNQTFEPLNFINHRKVLKLLMKEKVHVFINENGDLSVWDRSISTVSGKIQLPATLILNNRIVKRRHRVRFTRCALMTRDSWMCQYCGDKLGDKAATIDHIVPRSQGGNTSWSNCVAACKDCNKKKSGRTPEQASMALMSIPTYPRPHHFLTSRIRTAWHRDWERLLSTNA